MTAPVRRPLLPRRSALPPPSVPILRRGGAFLIDMIVLLLCSAPFHALVQQPEWVFDGAHGTFRMTNPVIVVGACSIMLIVESRLLVTTGASIGKMVCGLQVVAEEGGTISRRAAWTRTGVKMLALCLFAIPLLFQAVFVLFGLPHTFWDACAGTKVVREAASSA